MTKNRRTIKEKIVGKATHKVPAIVKALLNDEKALEKARDVENKYKGLPKDAIADKLIKHASRKTKFAGAINGAGVTGCEAVIANPTVPEPSHKIVAGSGIVALLMADLSYTIKVQVQLLLEIGHVYDCPFDSNDEDDAWIVFKAALGLKGAENIGRWGQIVFAETARKQFRKLLRTKGMRAALQKTITKIAGSKVGRLLGEKYIMRLLPVINMVIGYNFNRAMTNHIGKWAKIKAKVRSSTFKKIDYISLEDPNANIYVLPIIFFVATSDNKLTDNELMLYSKALSRLNVSEKDMEDVMRIIDNDDISEILDNELKKVKTKKIKDALFDIAITVSVINLKLNEDRKDAVKNIAKMFGINYSESQIINRLQYIRK